jgi:ATP-dependent helicase HepA
VRAADGYTPMARGAFNRSAALRVPGTRLLRRGNPLVDVSAEAIAVDDRGQATAIRRVDQQFTGDPDSAPARRTGRIGT